MEDYAGRVLAGRYRLPRAADDAFDAAETRAFDTYSGQEVLIRHIPLPETVEAEIVGDDGRYGPGAPGAPGGPARGAGDPAVRRALAAARAAAEVRDHPRYDQVFDVFAEGGGLWIVSELVAGRPLAELLAEHTLSPHRAAEVAADVLTALSALHAQGWIHRNITARTVLVCEDGRAMLTGLASGAAEEALCGYDPAPPPEGGPGGPGGDYGGPGAPGDPGGFGGEGRGGFDGGPGGRSDDSGSPGSPGEPGGFGGGPGPGDGAPGAARAQVNGPYHGDGSGWYHRDGSGRPQGPVSTAGPIGQGPGDGAPGAARAQVDGPCGERGSDGYHRDGSGRPHGPGGTAAPDGPGHETPGRAPHTGSGPWQDPDPHRAFRRPAPSGPGAPAAGPGGARTAYGPRPPGSGRAAGRPGLAPGRSPEARTGGAPARGPDDAAPAYGSGGAPAPGTVVSGTGTGASGAGPDGPADSGPAVGGDGGGRPSAAGPERDPGPSAGGPEGGSRPAGRERGQDPGPDGPADRPAADGRQPRSRAIAAYSAGARAAARAQIQPPGRPRVRPLSALPGPAGDAAARPGGTRAGEGSGTAPGLPGPALPGGLRGPAVPGPALPGGAVPGAAVPGGAPGPAVPGGPVPGPTAPGSGDSGSAEPCWPGTEPLPGSAGPSAPHWGGLPGAPVPAESSWHGSTGRPGRPGMPPGSPGGGKPGGGGPPDPSGRPSGDGDGDGDGPDRAAGGTDRPGRKPASLPPAGRPPHHSGAVEQVRRPGSVEPALRPGGERPGRTAPAGGPVGHRPAVPGQPSTGGWDETPGDGAAAGRYQRGPTTPLAAERARQARILVVGAVTERWAPEQAGPVHANWQLAPPIGPATDLWAVGALLFRAVQGHAPYPEENAAELVQLVCTEAPAFAEECGALRPVVESLLRQDPTERPEFEELRGWLRSLIRTAPEPDVGVRTVTVPSLGSGADADPRRLPVIRRRGELVRRRRGGGAVVHGRHKRAKEHRHSPRRLGRLLLLLILLALAGAVAYAMLFMPRAGDTAGGSTGRAGTAGAPSAAPSADASPGEGGEGTAGGGGEQGGSGSGSGKENDKENGKDKGNESGGKDGSGAGAGLAKGFELRTDPEGFRIAVHESWTRRGANSLGQVRYGKGDFVLTVVPGRDTVEEFGGDPMAYQQDAERELAPFRESQWSSASGLRRIEVGQTSMAEGVFTWRDDADRQIHTRNLAMIIDGRYHLVLVSGPVADKQEVARFFEQATATYRPTD